MHEKVEAAAVEEKHEADGGATPDALERMIKQSLLMTLRASASRAELHRLVLDGMAAINRSRELLDRVRG
jgi:hypothetical protein